jgi:hypothetical protein
MTSSIYSRRDPGARIRLAYTDDYNPTTGARYLLAWITTLIEHHIDTLDLFQFYPPSIRPSTRFASSNALLPSLFIK